MHKAHVYLIHFRRVAYTREQKENFHFNENDMEDGTNSYNYYVN